MPVRNILRFLATQVIHFLFSSQHLALIAVQSLLILFTGFAVVGWIVGGLNLVWKINPAWFADAMGAFFAWIMKVRLVTTLSTSYHMGTQEMSAFLGKVYFVSTIPVFLYDQFRGRPLSIWQTMKRRLKWTGLMALGTALSFAAFELIWPRSTWITLAGVVVLLWLNVVVLSGYVSLLQFLRDAFLDGFLPDRPGTHSVAQPGGQ